VTARVKELTLRASRESPGSPPTQPVRDLRAFLDALGRLGYDAADLLAAAGLKPSDLEDPDGHVPCAATGALICRAQERRPLSNMSLRLALETPLGAFPLLDYLVVSSDTVGEAFGQLARYLRITASPVVLEIFADEDPVRVVASSPGIPFAVEHLLALSVLHLGKETDGRLRVATLEFAHRPDDVREFERVLRCPVHAQAGWSGLLLPAASWRLPLRRRDATLKDMLERQAKEVVARSKGGSGAAFEVAQLLVTRVAGRDTRLPVVARQLGTSTRTLQRKLADEGVSYNALVEKARCRAAEGYLAESTLSVGEIGYLLGYSEPAAFHRAFRRWHRTTPAAYRHRAESLQRSQGRPNPGG
jgi:AraC-like DNA-binding protein